ncbi:MAG: ribonuclease P protein component [Alphaproteobacteria bacterium]|nr:ribonuclease P protein component [Alphaproteobacteria bacterium]MBU0798334.1 ribonuclease P protein component [Alphaproteobacteria bacterium]MBU0887435.1 ribonuclease P protein component [Alphaproteobacteria bacterium]MBU1813356.1 ribonuclease P protein component [Alphaproteobacteria bacterium]
MTERQERDIPDTGRSQIGRLKKRADFLRVAAVRRKWAAPGVLLQVALTPDTGTPGTGAPDTETPSLSSGIRIGFTASRKVGGAVVRNRARRRLRAAVDEVMPHHAKPGHDYVLIARRDTATRDYALLLDDLRLALKRTGAFRDRSADRGES